MLHPESGKTGKSGLFMHSFLGTYKVIRKCPLPSSFLVVYWNASPSPHATLLSYCSTHFPQWQPFCWLFHKRKYWLHVIGLALKIWKHRHFQDLVKHDLFGPGELGLPLSGKGRSSRAPAHNKPQTQGHECVSSDTANRMQNTSQLLGFITIIVL